MRIPFPALLVGILFGAGLALSDMINPARVLAFLDLFGAWDPTLAFVMGGAWDPTLAFVMGGALIPAAAGTLLSRRMRAPLFHSDFHIPANRVIDSSLVTGALLFGAGWGLVGYCPGPAIAGLVLGLWQPWLFVAAMIAGMLLHRFATRERAAKPAPAAEADA